MNAPIPCRFSLKKRESVHSTLVIGADGLHSKVRSLAFGPQQRFERQLG